MFKCPCFSGLFATLIAGSWACATAAPAGSTEQINFPSLQQELRATSPAPVQIERDAAGIPTIHASSVPAAYAGLCYAMAEDRLWQLDFLRRNGQGRLAEILGNDPAGATVGGDVVSRTLGLARSAKERLQSASLQGKITLQACSVGINAYIEHAKATATLPPEFGILGYQPDAWLPEDSLTVFAALVSGLDQITAFEKIDHALFSALLGPDIAADLVPDLLHDESMFDRHGNFNDPRIFLKDFIGTLPASHAAQTHQRAALQSFSALNRQSRGEHSTQLLKAWTEKAGRARQMWPATNSLMVSGGLSASGKPLYSNDFHLTNFTPSAIYLARMDVRGAFQLKGKFIPGFPAAIGGRNDRLVWGVTFAILDDADFYVESLDSSGEKVLYRNHLVPVQKRQEVIRVAGADPITITVRSTPHGPIVSDALPPLQQFGTLALKTTLAQPEWLFDGFFEFPQAATIQDLRHALQRESVGLNFSIADAGGLDGNIAFQYAGLAPQRSLDNTFVPVRGDDGSHEWQFYARQDQLPFVRNPPAGFFVVTNNRIVPEDYAPGGIPIYLSRYGDQPFRTRRGVQLITDVVDHGSRVSLAQARGIPTDARSAVSPAIARLLAAVIDQAGLPNNVDAATRARLQTMVQDLRSFDGHADPNSRAQLVYLTVWEVALKNFVTDLFPTNVYGADLGKQVFATYARDIPSSSRYLAAVEKLKNPAAPFFGASGSADAVAARNRSVVRSLLEAETLLTTQLGTDISTWSWGVVHVALSTHPLSQAIPQFALPPVSLAGDNSTLRWGGFFSGNSPFSKGVQLLVLPQNEFLQQGGLFAVFFPESVAAERVIWDVATPANDRGILSTGESGNPLSPHWNDMRPLFVSGDYVAF